MPTNPIEPPQDEPDASRATPRSRGVDVALGLLAVPAAAVAGAGTCVLSVQLFSFGAIAAGVAATMAVLVAAKWLQGRLGGSLGYNTVGAAVGLIVATPVALLVGYGFSFVVQDTADGSDVPWFVAMVLVPFLIWSVGFWVGLQWRAGRDQVENP